MFRKTMMCSVAVLLALPPRAFAQQTEENPDGAPLFGALVGGLIGGAIGAAVSRRAPRGVDLVPAVGGVHPPGGKAGGGAHKSAAAGVPMRKKLVK